MRRFLSNYFDLLLLLTDRVIDDVQNVPSELSTLQMTQAVDVTWRQCITTYHLRSDTTAKAVLKLTLSDLSRWKRFWSFRWCALTCIVYWLHRRYRAWLQNYTELAYVSWTRCINCLSHITWYQWHHQLCSTAAVPLERSWITVHVHAPTLSKAIVYGLPFTRLISISHLLVLRHHMNRHCIAYFKQLHSIFQPPITFASTGTGHRRVRWVTMNVLASSHSHTHCLRVTIIIIICRFLLLVAVALLGFLSGGGGGGGGPRVSFSFLKLKLFWTVHVYNASHKMRLA